jgi:hypothetical protein
MAVDAVDGGGGDDDDDESVGDNADDDGAAAAGGDSAASVAARNWPVDRTSLTLLRKFIIEVSHRLRQYKNELLAACVRLVLSVPRELIDVPVLVPSLDTALRLGVGYLPLARVGLDALERWLEVRPRSVAPYLTRVLPRLARLSAREHRRGGRSGGGGARRGDGAAPADARRRRATEAQCRRARRVEPGLPAATARDSRARTAGRGAPPQCSACSTSRRRAIAAPTTAPSWANCVDVSSRRPLAAGGGAAWDVEQLGRLQVGRFCARRPTCPLSTRCCRACSSWPRARARVPRKWRRASCCTRSCCSWSGGAPRTSRATTRTRRTPPGEERVSEAAHRDLHARLSGAAAPGGRRRRRDAPAVRAARAAAGALVLAWPRHRDRVARGGGARRQRARGARAPARRRAARLWRTVPDRVLCAGRSSRRATPDLAQSKTPARSLFKRLYALAHHPRASARLGFALAVNRLYRVLRESRALVSQFALELTATTLFSLRLSHSDARDDGTRAQLRTASRHLCRVLLYHAPLLAKASTTRRGVHNTLEAFVAWLFAETARPEPACRDEFQRMFVALAPHVPSTRTAPEWLERHAVGQRRPAAPAWRHSTCRRLPIDLSQVHDRHDH